MSGTPLTLPRPGGRYDQNDEAATRRLIERAFATIPEGPQGPPGDPGPSGDGLRAMVFEFGNGTREVTVGLLAGNKRLPWTTMDPFHYTLAALDADGEPVAATLTVDVMTRVLGGSFSSIVGTQKPTLAAAAEEDEPALIDWVLDTDEFIAAKLDTITASPVPYKVTLTVYLQVT